LQTALVKTINEEKQRSAVNLAMVVRYLEKAEISASEARKANNELKEQLANAKRQ